MSSSVNDTQRLRAAIRDVADFPKPGVVFKDITPLLQSAAAMKYVIAELASPFRDSEVTAVLAAEAEMTDISRH